MEMDPAAYFAINKNCPDPRRKIMVHIQKLCNREEKEERRKREEKEERGERGEGREGGERREGRGVRGEGIVGGASSRC